MRDAQSAFDQVIAFAGTTISADDVSTVLGLVRRELLLEMAAAVAREDGAAAFALADRAVEGGYDLRQVLRELSRLVRDLLVIKIDPARLSDPEIAAEGERDQLSAVAALYSQEDLLRAFEVISKGEQEIRNAVQPRFHLEMTLLRWIHLRKLVPLSDLIDGLGKGRVQSTGAGARPSLPVASAPPAAARARSQTPARAPAGRPAETSASLPAVAPVLPERLKDAFLEEVRKVKKFFHGTVIAQAQRIEIEGDRIVFTFGPQHRALRSQLEQTRPLLETIATQLAGRRMTVAAAEGAAAVPSAPSPQPDAPAAGDSADRKAALREQALADSGVQAMLDVFAAEIRDVEEM
jgi:DNA polymerase-3 subunit gamma/tau